MANTLKLELGLLLCLSLRVVPSIGEDIPVPIAIEEVPTIGVRILADRQGTGRR